MTPIGIYIVTDLLEEVLSDHKDAKKLYYFRKLLPIVIMITALVVVGMFIYNWQAAKQNDYNTKMGDVLLKSVHMTNADPSTAFNSLNSLVEKSDTRVAEIALIEQVGIKINAKDYISAKVILEKIISNKNYYNITTSYARIIWLSLVIDQDVLTDEENQRFQNYLDYFSNEDQEFFGTASLLKGFWYIRNNQINIAKEVLKTAIATNNATGVVKEQARALLSTIE